MLVLLIKEGLTDFNYIKAAYVFTTDPSFLRMTRSERDRLQAILFSTTERRVMDSHTEQRFKDTL
ncbi:hypothetical protein [Flavisolibacter ginsengisoli]|jgi:hypothetical protein|uniref:hypothetical protein n=1 Tax=Flavisolibacter ginsengisoli TaxID=462367 RepID=UPI001C31E7CC|nr:hypothetical protein [Flavisolibacter ginsengisoli]